MSDFESRARKAAESVREQIDQHSTDDERAVKRAQRSALRTTIPSTIAVLVLIAGGLFIVGRNDSSSPKSGPQIQLAASLQPFNACADTLKYFQTQSPQYYEDLLNNGGGVVEPLQAGGGMHPDSEGLPGKGRENAPTTTIAPTPGAAPGATSTSSSAPQFSTTNVQVAGVDEPDTIKTDGNIVVAVDGNGSVDVLTANAGHPQLQSTLNYDGTVDNILLSGSRVVLFDGNGGTDANQEIVTTYDISNPTKPQLVGQLTVDGSLVDPRMVGTQIRVATSFEPDPNVPSPNYDDNGNITAKSLAALPGEMNSTTLKDWLPQFTLTNSTGAMISSGQLVQCNELSHPNTFAGLDSTSLFTFDVNSAPSPNNTVAVLADGEQMYATATDTYISSTAYDPAANDPDDNTPDNTDIHEFVTDASGASKYVGSGTVDGSLLSSYSMDENDGVLRVASTTQNEEGLLHPHEEAQGIVTTLRKSGNKLTQAGKLTGLGAAQNEPITAVRFVGDRGYVSTSRQSDPFYVIDLSDPSNPKLAGQLQVPGSTNYLEPLSNNLVLAVGDVGSNASVGIGRPVPVPMQIAPGGGAISNGSPNIAVSPGPVPYPGQSQLVFSLYDVSDPSSPKQVGQLKYTGGSAEAQFDPHAFLYWQPRNLVIAPAEVNGLDGLSNFNGLLMMQADGTTLKEIGRLADTSDDSTAFSVTRSIVIDNNVYMLSGDNLQVDSLDTHAQVANVALPGN